MRKVYGSIKDTLYSDTLDVLKASGIKYRATVSPLNIKLSNGSEIIFKGADDPEKLKGLSSVSIVLMDEANEFMEQDFETIDQSIRGNHFHSIYLCHNPVPKVPGSMYWFEKQFKIPTEPGEILRYYDDNLGAHVSSVRTTYKHNEHCPEHVKRRLEGYKETNPALYKLWALGQYAEMKGVILSNRS
jgi:phage terminase large subunit